MKKIHAFIFDIGNVLLRLDYTRAQRLLREANAPEPDRSALATVAKDYERGLMDSENFLSALSGIYGHAVDKEILRSAWVDMFEPHEPMWNVVMSLQGRFPLYLLSNTNALHHDFIVQNYEIFKKFSDGVYSYQAKLLKPEPEIYHLAIQQFGVCPEETCYIDDLTLNVEGACAAGLQALHYDLEAHEDFVAELCGLGVQCH